MLNSTTKKLYKKSLVLFFVLRSKNFEISLRICFLYQPFSLWTPCQIQQKKRGYLYISFFYHYFNNLFNARTCSDLKKKTYVVFFFSFPGPNTMSKLTGSKIQRPRSCKQKTTYDFVKNPKAPL